MEALVLLLAKPQQSGCPGCGGQYSDAGFHGNVSRTLCGARTMAARDVTGIEPNLNGFSRPYYLRFDQP